MFTLCIILFQILYILLFCPFVYRLPRSSSNAHARTPFCVKIQTNSHRRWEVCCFILFCFLFGRRWDKLHFRIFTKMWQELRTVAVMVEGLWESGYGTKKKMRKSIANTKVWLERTCQIFATSLKRLNTSNLVLSHQSRCFFPIFIFNYLKWLRIYRVIIKLGVFCLKFFCITLNFTYLSTIWFPE